MTKLILFLLLTSSLSCIKRVDIKLPHFENRLVVHGYIALGDLFSVTVGQTVKSNVSGSDTYLSNALVVLFENGVVKDTLRYDLASQYYVSKKVVAEAGKPYTIKVEVDGFQPVEATATGIPVPSLASMQQIRKARHTTYGNELDDIKFSFRDPANVKNYYLTAVFPSWRGSSGVGCVYSTDPAIEQPRGSALPFDDGDCIDSKAIFFTDQSFDGQLKEFILSANSFSLESHYDATEKRTLRAYIKRYAISEEFYKYYKYTSTVSSLDDVPFVTEIADAKGNVKNGYGLFTIFGLSTDTLR